MNKKHFSVLVVILILLLFTTTVRADSGWLVEKTAPTVIGPKVSEGTKNDPDVDWLAPVGGLLQTVFWDNDPKCNEDGATLIIQRISDMVESFLVPRAPIHNGNCNDTVQALYSSRIFDVTAGDIARADMGGDSGHYWFYFATSTPGPTNTPIPTNTPTNTPVPTSTSTNTPAPTDTPTVEPTATKTTVIIEPTPTPTATPGETPLPPELPSVCMSVTMVPELPETIPAEGVVIDIYVEAINPAGYTLVNGEYSLYFETQPLMGIRIRPNEHYVVKVSAEDKGCEIGVRPTALDPVPQPTAREYNLHIPFSGK